MSALRSVYESYTAASARSAVETAPPPNKVAEGMDSARFYKLIKDGKLLNKTFRYNDVDLVFTKYKLAGQRRMDYRGFKAAMSDIAVKRGESLEQLSRTLIEQSSGTPSISGTEAIPNRFHDDKSTFTGVYREGGPTTIDREKMSMSDLCDRFKKATVRGTPLHVAVGPGIMHQQEGLSTPGGRLSFDQEGAMLDDDQYGGGGGGGQQLQTPNTGGGRRSSTRASLTGGSGAASLGVSTSLAADQVEPLRRVFETYQMASTRSADLGANLPPPPNPVADGVDSAKFYKLIKDSNLLNKNFRYVDVDLVFTKYKLAGQRKMAWKGFKAALAEVALKRGDSFDALVQRVIDATSNGPSINGTEAIPNRFHDDKSTFTGVYREGGPTTIDREKMSMSDLCDRFKKATVRGTPLHVAVGPGINQQLAGVLGGGGGGDGFSDQGSYNGGDLPVAQSPYHPSSSFGAGTGAGGDVHPLKENTVQGQRSKADDSVPDHSKDGLHVVYEEYSKLSRGFASSKSIPSTPSTPAGHHGHEDGIDSSRWLRLCNEASLFGKLFRTNDVDLVFTRNKKERKLNFEGFVMSLLEVAVKKNVTLAEVVDQVVFAVATSARFSSGTVAEANRFYDDKKTWTGAAAAAAVVDQYASPMPPPPPAFGGGGGGGGLATSLTEQDLAVPREQYGELCRVYEAYAVMSRALKDRSSSIATTLSPDDGIDSSRWLKLVNDAQLFDSAFTPQHVDIIFTKSKGARDARKLSLDGLIQALAEVCRKKGKPMRDVLDAVIFATAAGPSINGTVAEGGPR